MTSKQPTKAELQAENGRLREENAALRDLIAEMQRTADVPFCVHRADREAMHDARWSALCRVADWPDVSDLDTIRSRTELFRKNYGWSYVGECGEDIDDSRWCKLPQGHDGEHSPTPRETCPRVTKGGSPCVRHPGHPGDHKAPEGSTWATGGPLDGGSILRAPEDAGEQGKPQPAHHVDPDSGMPPCFQPGHQQPGGDHACTAQPGHTGDHVTFDGDANEVARWPQGTPPCNTVMMPSGYGCTLPAGHDGEHEHAPLTCVLPAGHAGRHLGPADTDGEITTEVTRNFDGEADQCTETDGEDNEGSQCIIDAGHSGSHLSGNRIRWRVCSCPGDERTAAQPRREVLA